MGKRGPRPAPEPLRLLRTGKPSRTTVPVPPAGPVEPPDYLDADARAIWERLSPDLERKGVLTAWDVDCFAVFCTAVVHHRRAAVEVNSDGVLVASQGRGPQQTKHPAMQLVRDQAAIVRAFAQEFGLTPSARRGLGLPEWPLSEPDDLLGS